MADAVTSQTLADGDRIAVVKFTNISDGTGESSVEKVDISALAASTNYHLKITMDSDRKLSVFVNGEQYGLATTATTTFDGTTSVTGTTQATIDNRTQKSTAMTNDINLIPYIGIEAGDGAAAALDVQFEAISRLIFE